MVENTLKSIVRTVLSRLGIIDWAYIVETVREPTDAELRERLKQMWYRDKAASPHSNIYVDTKWAFSGTLHVYVHKGCDVDRSQLEKFLGQYGRVRTGRGYYDLDVNRCFDIDEVERSIKNAFNHTPDFNHKRKEKEH